MKTKDLIRSTRKRSSGRCNLVESNKILTTLIKIAEH